MSDRNVRIVITAAAADALKAFKDVENGLKGIDKEGEKSAGVGDKIKEGLQLAGVVLSVEGLKNALVSVVSTGLEFEANLNTMQAVSGASADAMGLVSERAKQLGNDILLPGQSASDAAEAMTELAKGGMSVDEAMTAAKGTLQLAAAAQISGADAAIIQTSALNAFGLSAGQAGRVADVLANVANQSAGEITDFAAGMAQSATVAHSFGIGVEDTATALGIFANAGIKGSDAGTSFKTMLTALASPTKQQAAALQELGVTAFDAQGKFVGMKTIVEQLATAKANMSQQDYLSAASTAFGADAVRAAAVIAEGGTAAWDNMSTAVGKVGGAADVAAAQSQGLNGMISDFQNTVETAALSLFERLSPALESVVGFATTAASAFATVLGWVEQIPGPVWEAAAAFGGIVVAAQVAGWLGGIAATALAAAGGLASMGGAAMIASVGLNALGGPWVVALGVAAAAIAFFADNTDAATVATADLTGAIDANTGAFTSNAAAIISQQTEDAASKYVALGGAVGDFTAALMGAPAAQERVNATLLDASVAAAQAAGASDEYIAALKEGGVGAQQFIDSTKEGEASVAGFAGATGTAAEVSQVYSQGLQQLTETQAGAKTAAEEAAAANTTQADSMTDSGDAAAAAAPSVDSLKAATEGLQSAANLADAAVQFLSASLDAAAGHSISAEQAYRLQEAAIRNIGASTRDTADAMADADAKATAVQEAIDKYGSSSNEAAAAQRDFENAQQAVNDATDDQFTANVKARDSALAYTSSVYANAAANGDLTGAADQATWALDQAKQAFIAAQPQADILSGKAQQTADKLYGIPKDTVAKIAETGAAAAQAAAQGVSSAVNNIPPFKSVTLSAEDQASGIISRVQSSVNGLQGKTIYIDVVTSNSGTGVYAGGQLIAGGGYTGGKVGELTGMQGFASGGKIPGVAPADPRVDNLIGFAGGGAFGLRSQEWIINQQASEFYGDDMLRAINNQTYVPPAASMSAALSSGYSGGAAVNVAAPVVKVFIGDEEITSRVSVVVDGQLSAVARQAKVMGAQSWA